MMGDIGSVRIVSLGEVSYLESQTLYHSVAQCMTENSPDTIILCRPRESYFCIGYHQNSLHVLDNAARMRLGFPVMRRQLGGGVTYLDSQQLFYQCIFHRSRSPAIPAQVYKARLEAPIKALQKLGLNAELLYVNEIEISGKRIAGIGGGLIGEASVVVGNILNDFNYQAMAEIINAPCDTFRQLALAAMHRRITTLSQERCTANWSQLSELLVGEYEQSFGRPVYLDKLASQECEKATKLAEKMVSNNYLEQYRNSDFQQSKPLTRLKISGSTWIELVGVKHTNHLKYCVLMIKDDVIEEISIADELDDQQNYTDDVSGLKTCYPTDLRVGNRFSRLS